jgi:hypothetical protein
MSNTALDMNDLDTTYQPVAVYLEDADTVEYVRLDRPCLYHRVDGILTLALDLHTRELNGFRLKGFKNFFLKHLKPKYRLLDDDFIPLVSAIEQAIQVVGEEITRDPDRQAAYRQAKCMAHQDSVSIKPLAA